MLQDRQKWTEQDGQTGLDPPPELSAMAAAVWRACVPPNRADVEINVRQTVFYPEKPRVNFITVRGFTMEHAATPWAPPTAAQIGLIGTHWSKGWIIENNTIRYSVCTGITLGKHGDPSASFLDRVVPQLQ